MLMDYLNSMDDARKSSWLRHEIKGSKSLIRRLNKEIRKIEEAIIIEAKHSAKLGRNLIDKESELSSAELLLQEKEEILGRLANQSLDL